jgi:hypothetical protein
MSKSHVVIHNCAVDFWLAGGDVLVSVALQLLLVNDLTFGRRRLAPATELVVLVPVSIATAWTQTHVRVATADHHWDAIGNYRVWIGTFRSISPSAEENCIQRKGSRR